MCGLLWPLTFVLPVRLLSQKRQSRTRQRPKPKASSADSVASGLSLDQAEVGIQGRLSNQLAVPSRLYFVRSTSFHFPSIMSSRISVGVLPAFDWR